MADRRRSSLGPANSDEPPNSRLFIIGPKNLGDEDYRKAFGEFGHIEEVRLVKDRQTGDNKGVAYVKFSKTSEAAKALESMNGKVIGLGRSIKVMIAASRDQGSKRDSNANEEERMLRLFIIVPKSMDDRELYDYFKQFGDIDYASIIKDKATKESKGYAYVKYTKFSHAATAFEQSDRKYKAVFAQPRKPKEDRFDRGLERDFPLLPPFNVHNHRNPVLPPPDNYRDDGYTRLRVIVDSMVNQDQLWKLFDIVPTMDYCQVHYERERGRAEAEVAYASPQWAAYAREKFHGLEYPPGYRLIARPEYDYLKRVPPQSLLEKNQPDIMKIAETLAQATSLIKAAGLSGLQEKLGLIASSKFSEVNCNVELPDPQPMANVNEETKARCFIVCTPSPLPNSALKDVFCRFGNLLDVYLLNNKNFGYARYCSVESAKEAILTLHGAEIQGIRIKVMEAEDRPDGRKRQRLNDDPL